MCICISLGICDPLPRDKSLNSAYAFSFGLILMAKFSTSHILDAGIAYRFKFLDC